jgi:hypothetical protein
MKSDQVQKVVRKGCCRLNGENIVEIFFSIIIQELLQKVRIRNLLRIVLSVLMFVLLYSGIPHGAQQLIQDSLLMVPYFKFGKAEY